MSNGQFSPPNGNYPQEVSEKWVLEDGTIQENLKELTDEQLNALGWSGPITFPAEYVYYSNNVEWNKETKSFDIQSFLTMSLAELSGHAEYSNLSHVVV